MIPEKLQEIMKQDGVVAIATLGKDGSHRVNTWNSYLRTSEDGRLLIPAGYMHRTEANIAFNPEVLITLGSSKVKGLHVSGAGFLFKGKAVIINPARSLICSRRNSNGCGLLWPSPSILLPRPGKPA